MVFLKLVLAEACFEACFDLSACFLCMFYNVFCLCYARHPRRPSPGILPGAGSGGSWNRGWPSPACFTTRVACVTGDSAQACCDLSACVLWLFYHVFCLCYARHPRGSSPGTRPRACSGGSWNLWLADLCLVGFLLRWFDWRRPWGML